LGLVCGLTAAAIPFLLAAFLIRKSWVFYFGLVRFFSFFFLVFLCFGGDMSPYLAWYYVLSFFFCFLPFPSFVFSCVDVLRWFGAALVRLFFLFSV